MFLFLTLACVGRADATPKPSILKTLLSDCAHLETPQRTGCFPFKLDFPSADCMPRAAWPYASLLPVTQLGPHPMQHNSKTAEELYWEDWLCHWPLGSQRLSVPNLRGENPQLSRPGRGLSHPLLFLHGLLNPGLWAAKTFLSPRQPGPIAPGLLDTTWHPSTPGTQSLQEPLRARPAGPMLGSTVVLWVPLEGDAPAAPLGACSPERQDFRGTPVLTVSHWLALGSSWAGCRVFPSASPCSAHEAQRWALGLGSQLGPRHPKCECCSARALLGIRSSPSGQCLMLDITLHHRHHFSNLAAVLWTELYPLSSFNNQNVNDQEKTVFRSGMI